MSTQQVILARICGAGLMLALFSVPMMGQESHMEAPSSSSTTPSSPDSTALPALIRDLQDQVRMLNQQLADLRSEQQLAKEETRELRRELDLVKAEAPPSGIPDTKLMAASVHTSSADPAAATAAVAAPVPAAPQAAPQSESTSERLSKLEENQEILEGKIDDQYQTKIESGSKYRLRLSGIVLLNLYENRGLVNNQDFPQMAIPFGEEPLFASPGSFGGSLRQSQLHFQAFGPTVAGAKTSADVMFDFAGGFPSIPNGAVMGEMRMRTAVLRMDWANTSIVGGQDSLFFAPLSPTSLATLGVPALAYAGNLWAWTPQVRVEHRFALSGDSRILVQGGILDSLTGDTPYDDYSRDPSWGEESGQPVYAARISWTHRVFDQNLTVGFGGYYGRQNWGYNRTLDGWGGTTDVSLPLGKKLEFTGAFYRGRGASGFGGGLGQPIVINGPFSNPATRFQGLDSMGGWGQLKFKVTPKLEVNGAMGIDNPFAGELRQYNANSIYPYTFTRNVSPMANVIYQIRSDILISTEYRWMQTSVLDSGSIHASHINLSLGYLF